MMQQPWILKILSICSFILCFNTTSAAAPLRPQLIYLGVDGFSFEAMVTAQKRGLFKEFQFGAHVAPFPSMSDVSWNSVMKTSEIFGEQGRLRSAEAVYFDESTGSVGGDVRDFYRRLAHPKYYMGGFDIFFNPYLEGLMYFPTNEIPKLEIKNVIDDILASEEKPVISAFIAGPDSMAHTQHGKLYPILKILDQELKRLSEGMKEKGLIPHIVLVSDHGNVGRFAEGANEVELLKIELSDVAKKYGFRMVNTLVKDEDIAIPLLALGSWAPVFIKNQKLRGQFLKKISGEKWFDLGMYITKQTSQQIHIHVVSNEGEADLIFDKINNRYSWNVLSGNVLGIASFNNYAEGKTTALAAKSKYPDAFYRIVRSAMSKDFDFPDILITSKDGYCFDNSLSEFTKMYRTHGSLTAGSTLGVVASNFNQVPLQLRSQDILEYFGIKAELLYRNTYETHRATSAQGLKDLKYTSQAGVVTNSRDLSTKNLFQHITRFIADTRPFFVVSEISELMSAFQGIPGNNKAPHSYLKFDPSKFDFKAFLKPADIGALTDVILQNPDLSNIRNHQVVKSLELRAKQQTGDLLTSTNENNFMKSGGPAVHAKRATMKIFQLPPLLERALSLQERTSLKETRDFVFAEYWDKARNYMTSSSKNLQMTSGNKTVSERLFEETFKEASLENRIFPTPLKKVYNRQLKDLTVVYVPGIYNSIFDKEIFSLGIKKLEEGLSLRVLTAPTESTCSTSYNGNLLMKFLQNDFALRQQKLGIDTKYLILGYSKGSVDALAGFVTNSDFVSKNILGLVSIASPLQGSSILDRADLPFQLVEALSSQKAPEVCLKESAAGKSLTPSALSNFWKRYGKSLIGLTRYFSVSFVSEMEDSHLFMRATKLIAQFDEDNDGVVTLTSSHYPEYIGAVNLGTIKADHLAGVLSSRFDQQAFFQALAQTLAELDVGNTKGNLKWNFQQIVEQANKTTQTGHYSFRENNEGITFYHTKNLILMRKILPNATNTLDINKLLLPMATDPADTYEPKVKLPENQLHYEVYNTISLKNLSTQLSKAKVKPLSPREFPTGVQFDINQQNMIQFRIDHQFNYEDTSPAGADDNNLNGYKIVSRGNLGTWLQMKSKGTSVRMTTLAYRFRPVDFPKFSTQLAVTKAVSGADVIKGGSGKDDSAFQAWFVLRVGNATKDRSLLNADQDKTVLFGYYWGTPTSSAEKQAGQIFENYYSKKNYVAIRLPEAKQVLLENPTKLNQELMIKRDFAKDLKDAFPDLKVEDLEVIAITLQHDSNDTKSESESFLKNLKIEPINLPLSSN
ncbi:MAG: hypothetical protein AABY64_13415 [Bdellovibrionota bacterium]